MSQQILPIHRNQWLTSEMALVQPEAGICFSALPTTFFFFFSFRKGSWRRVFTGG